MTVSTAPTPLPYSGNGSTTAFAITWKYNAKSHVVATLRSSAGVETVQTLTTHYTLTDPGDSGTLTMVTAPATGETLVITLEPPNTQSSDIPLGGDFPSTTVEDGLDLSAQRDAKIEALFLRALRVPKTDSRTGSNLELPIDTARASMFLAFDADGDPIAAAGTSANLGPVSSFIDTLLDDTTALAARTTLGAMGPEFMDAKGDLIVATAADTYARKAVGSNGTLLVPNSDSTDGLVYLDAHFGQSSLIGGYLDWSVAASALTCAIKTNAGNDPSTTEPVYALFRNATAGTGSLALVRITAATSATLSSGSTAGTTSGQISKIWAVLFNDGGTLRIGLTNCSNSTNIFPLADDILASSTAEGGAGAADTAGVIYTGTAVTAKAMRVLGYMESTQATAGTWATTPSKEQMWTPGMKLPGDILQTATNQTGAVASGTTVVPDDDTIPQISEGDEYMTQAITPTSSANRLRIEVVFHGASSGTADMKCVALFQDATAGALAAARGNNSTANAMECISFSHYMIAGTVSATTFKVRAGGAANTLTFNGSAGARKLGGVLASSLSVVEIMS